MNSRSLEDVDVVADAPEISGRLDTHLIRISPYEREKVKD